MIYLSEDVWHGLVAKNRSFPETSFMRPPEFPLLQSRPGIVQCHHVLWQCPTCWAPLKCCGFSVYFPPKQSLSRFAVSHASTLTSSKQYHCSDEPVDASPARTCICRRTRYLMTIATCIAWHQKVSSKPYCQNFVGQTDRRLKQWIQAKRMPSCVR